MRTTQPQNRPGNGWHFWIDRGGTFTDVVAIDPAGSVRVHKLLSQDPSRYTDAAIAGIQHLLAAAGERQPIISTVRMGTTVATNALLERKGARTALLTTAGFRDVLRIGTQQRPEVFALDIRLPDMLYAEVIEASERISADGDVLLPLDDAALLRDLCRARAAGIQSIAICLLHADRHPQHERRAAEIAAAAGFSDIHTSHEVSPTTKMTLRGSTTVADAYLSPIVSRYVASFMSGLRQLGADVEPEFMQSHGGLVPGGSFRGRNSILSGPAGGIVGMVHTAQAAGFEQVIGFDMGGTSTDVALYAGEFERTAESRVAGIDLAIPMLDIHTVAAGGGSIIRLENRRLLVGPDSAGAYPGPCAYRNGGPLTLTDANVLLGRIQPAVFPCVFGPDGNAPLDGGAVEDAFAALARDVAAATGTSPAPAALAAGAIAVAVDTMANAIKEISVGRGHDPQQFILNCFGGAAGQHACRVAEALEVRTILIHPLASLLSALGIGLAEHRDLSRQSLALPLADPHLPELQSTFAALEHTARQAFAAARSTPAEPAASYRLDIRPLGADSAIQVEYGPEDSAAVLAARFAAAHRLQFGFEPSLGQLEVAAIEVELVVTDSTAANALALRPPANGGQGAALTEAMVWFDGKFQPTPVHQLDTAAAGLVVTGPALLIDAHSTVVVEPGWSARTDAAGNLVLERRAQAVSARNIQIPVESDPVQLEIMNNAFMHVARQMGIVLQHTAHSVNIKERLDFSCAIFDAQGNLIANAPHVPVHLGSMSESVRAVLSAEGNALPPGSAYLLNAPYDGGTHLPDITLVSPVHLGAAPEPDYIVASRAHHADVGGITPGSMPAFSRTIDEEGVLLRTTRILDAGVFDEARVRSAFASGPWPARNLARNLADIRAQLAANARGIRELTRLVGAYGREFVAAYVEFMRRNAAAAVRAALHRLGDGRFVLPFDSGEQICVAVQIHGDEASIDFTGTSPASDGNLNAPLAVTRSVVLYVFRTLLASDIPLNSGCLEPISLQVPANSMLNPAPPRAVVGGNVETSQRVADALFGALGVLAGSQGTMNNLTFGNTHYQYYETLCGGAGASARENGASAVHTHMTNSRLTDPEILELRFPVRVRRFAIRTGSGGNGLHRGGDGVIREIEFLEPVTVTVLSSSRRVAPFGLHGGEPGAVGQNRVIRANGRTEALQGIDTTELGAGDRLVIETPGGGGFGAPGQGPSNSG